ncbi:hypothetical protein QCM77_18970 [Bradyrhizobium sp. SSUT18]|uniref:hypothetical protein n=1 Tax=Bradyrhizobium sp. SSUT18 TaxID=3040602 RepID=UPI00244BDA32|nr:hypothetical protein [Bradyrhizobium sp. SSUT18]MDH2402025.1 hypothetical protein [Bradyrhizobium sp. SSUT18]
MSNKGKPRRPLESNRVMSSLAGHLSYEERRGLRRVEIDMEGKGPESAKELAKKLNYAANRLLQKAGEKSLETVMNEARASKANDPEAALDQALAAWVAGLTLKYGFFSPATLAARLLGHSASLTSKLTNALVPEGGLDDAAAEAALTEQQAMMAQIYGLADAWHWFHMEVFGEHELAYAKRKHTTGTAKGSAATAEKAAKRARIISVAIEGAREAGHVDMNNASAVARAIKISVDEECVREGLPRALSMDSFVKAVTSVLKNGKS